MRFLREGSMRRREFITMLGGMASATYWPSSVLAQQSSATRRIGVLMSGNAQDKEAKDALAAFIGGLQQLGWTDGRNLRVDLRLGAGDADIIRKHAAELAALSPDLIVTYGTSAIGQLVQATRTVPILFVLAPDPVGSGFVNSLSRPGGNATGFMAFEYSLSAKWPELLKQIAPGVRRAAVLWDPAIAAGIGQFATIQSVAPSLGLELDPVNLRNVEQGVAAFAHSGGGGLIVTASGLAVAQRDLIVSTAAQYRLPTVYSFRGFVDAGGLVSYAASSIDQFRLAAGYADRILKGEKPADLPVQAPTKYDLVINLKTAKTLDLAIPPIVLARASEVIE
jgi:putative tryptophan/tyrosine transport system substrate-binding protein